MKNERQRTGVCIALIAILLVACGGSGSTTSIPQYDENLVVGNSDDNGIVEIPDDDGMGGIEEAFADADEEEYVEQSDDDTEFQMTGVMETCRHCMGYGIVQDGLYGVAQYCKFCGGQRVVDAAVNQLPDDFFEQANGQDVVAAQDYGTDKERIAAEIERLEEDIAQMEHQLEYIEGDIQSNYLRQQIIIAKSEVRRLQQMLNQ